MLALGVALRCQIVGWWFSWIAISGTIVCAQSSDYVEPPSQLLAPVTTTFREDVTVFPEADSFDGYSDCACRAGQLRLLDTIGIPFGVSGSESQWGEDVLRSTTVERFRKKFVQRVELNGGWVPPDANDSFGYSYASAAITMVVPLKTTDSLLVFTPRHRVDWLSGPTTLDVPGQLNATSIDIGWRRVWSERFSTIVGVQPGWYSDGDASQVGFRMGGLILLSYELFPKRLTVMAGAVYLDRNDFSWLPALGFQWTPTPDWRCEITFPRPRIAYRVGHLPYQFEDWVYLAAAIGGNSYAVRRVSGADDELSFQDYRIVFGGERLIHGGTGFHLETGFVFGRALEYASTGLELTFNESWVVEAGWRF